MSTSKAVDASSVMERRHDASTSESRIPSTLPPSTLPPFNPSPFSPAPRSPGSVGAMLGARRISSEIATSISAPLCASSRDRHSKSSTHATVLCSLALRWASNGTSPAAHLRSASAETASNGFRPASTHAGSLCQPDGTRRHSHATMPEAAGPFTENGRPSSHACSCLRQCSSSCSVCLSSGAAKLALWSTAATTSSLTRPGCASASRCKTATSAWAASTAAGHLMPRM